MINIEILNLAMIFNRKDKDTLFTDETKRHILVIHKGNFYAFDVLNENGINDCYILID